MICGATMQRLRDGLRHFEANTRFNHAPNFARLAHVQTPPVMFLTCSDSRLVPELFTSSGPGDMFFVRNIANIVPPYDEKGDASVPAAVMFAVEVLGVSDIVVCGHSDCGGMKALLKPPPRDVHLARWLSYGASAVNSWREGGATAASSQPEHDQLSQWSVRKQVDNLAGYPSVRERVSKGTLKLHTWWFDIEPGAALAYSPVEGRFVPAVEELDRLLGAEASKKVA